jgi:tetratricopeptide (TPR) repeat protein
MLILHSLSVYIDCENQYGNQLYRIGKYSEATLAFNKAIARGQKYQLLGNSGKALSFLFGRNNAQALMAISTAIAAVPANERGKYYYLWKYQSFILRESGKYDDALRSIDIAIRLEPSDSTLLNEKANIFREKKQYQEAIAIYDLVISKQPEPYAYSNRGIVKYKLGQNQAAIIDYDRAIAINPNFAMAYSNRGPAKSELGQNQAAIIDYDQAVAINFNDAVAYSNRGLAKYKLGQNQAAIIDYNRAIAINPIFANASLHLIEILHHHIAGESQTAKYYLDRAN